MEKLIVFLFNKRNSKTLSGKQNAIIKICSHLQLAVKLRVYVVPSPAMVGRLSSSWFEEGSHGSRDPSGDPKKIPFCGGLSFFFSIV